MRPMQTKTCRGVLLMVSAWSLALGAFAQAPPQQPPSLPPTQSAKPNEAKAKVKKVWTEDDLGSARKPWDDYADQKQAAEQAPRTAPSPAEPKDAEKLPSSAVDPKTGKPYDDPDSPKAIERELAKWQDELKRNEHFLEEARREVQQAPDPDRLELAKAKLEVFEQNIVDIKQKVQQTQDQLAEARKRSRAGAQPAPASPAENRGN